MTASVVWNGRAEALELEFAGAEADDLTTASPVAVHAHLDATVEGPLGLILNADPHPRHMIGL